MNTRRILITLLALLCAAATALAQQPANVPPPPLNGHCTRTTVDLEGLQDNFGGPSEPTTPSPALQAYLATHNGVGYDTAQPNHHVGESFLVCPCEACGAKLEIRVRHTNPLDVWNNDNYTVGIAPFASSQNQVIATGQIWNGPGDTAPKTITVALSGQALSKLLCGSKSQFLDVVVQDDTTVDWMRLTIQQP